MATPDPIHVAALDLVTSVSERNLRHGLTYWMQVPRGEVAALARALEEAYPGAIDYVYEERRKGEQA